MSDTSNFYNRLPAALGLPAGADPFPWQHALLARLLNGDLPDALDLPTGLGKTSVMALWLLARVAGAPLPRRLVYVVDRRAVVDQATAEAERLRGWVTSDPEIAAALGLTDRPLPISTLRGQYVDNREWLEDPSSTAIVVGTVDMVGSRLLFSGYGTSLRMRPYHAGLLGHDTLIVLDEAHLVPAFETLLRAVAEEQKELGPKCAMPVPPVRLLSLSATARTSGGRTFRLDRDAPGNEVVKQRLDAAKRLTLLAEGPGKLVDALVMAAQKLVAEAGGSPALIVYCDRRDDAEAVTRGLRKVFPKAEFELFVGARRVAERDAARRRLGELGFLPGTEGITSVPRILVATSAAEVGVDLDADHLVCDVVAWERMVQRLGRVNRRGRGVAQVHVVATPSEHVRKARGASPEGPISARHRVVVELLEGLPVGGDGARDASPWALQTHSRDPANRARVEEATTPPPLRPALDRPTVDAWAMTSVAQHPGRTLVAPWLRGWVEEDEPQVRLVWRAHLPSAAKPPLGAAEEARWFEAVPVHTSEVLETEAYRAAAWLIGRAARGRKREGAKAEDEANRVLPDEVVAVLLDDTGAPGARWRLAELDLAKDRLTRALAGHTLVIDARLGGLGDGLLSEDTDVPATTADGDAPWVSPEDPPTRYRVRVASAGAEPTEDPRWRERARFAWRFDATGEVAEWRVVDRLDGDPATEDDRASGALQTLVAHQACTERWARDLGARLGLASRDIELLAVAAALHDEGKRAANWQRAMNAPRLPHEAPVPYAKTRGPMNTHLLAHYRHEFGSLPYAEADPRVAALSPEERDLVLHLIAAHHGGARPVLDTRGCADAPPELLQARAREVTLRYCRMQERWGPWGLAWWEAVLRAADQQASRENERSARVRGGAR